MSGTHFNPTGVIFTRILVRPLKLEGVGGSREERVETSCVVKCVEVSTRRNPFPKG